jgi:hypothetical protein
VKASVSYRVIRTLTTITTPTIDERVTSSDSPLKMIDLVGNLSTPVVISRRQYLGKEFEHLTYR